MIPLVQNNQDDFWLNILAGVPFLFFDFIIITILLPFALEWISDLRWRPTRVAALKRMFDNQCKLAEPLKALYDVLPQSKTSEASPAARVGEAEFHRLRREVLSTADIALTECEQIVQTIIPALGPVLAGQVLQLHFDWVSSVRTLKGAYRDSECPYPWLIENHKKSERNYVTAAEFLLIVTEHIRRVVDQRNRLINAYKLGRNAEWLYMALYDGPALRPDVASVYQWRAATEFMGYDAKALLRAIFAIDMSQFARIGVIEPRKGAREHWMAWRMWVQFKAARHLFESG